MTRPPSDPAPLARVPSLDELASDLSRVAELPVELARRFLTTVHVLEGELFARTMAGASADPAEAHDESLDVSQAAKVLGLAETTLYRRARRPPFEALLVETGTRRLLFSRRRIEEFLARGRR